MGKKYLYGCLCCLAVYWLSNSILWIPWKISVLLGSICMLIYVPITWGGISIVCLRKFGINERRRSKYFLGTCFTAMAMISDVIFYIGYRKVPEELIKPATFGAYFLCFFAPIITGYILEKKNDKAENDISISNIVIVSVLGVTFFLLTILLTRFW